MTTNPPRAPAMAAALLLGLTLVAATLVQGSLLARLRYEGENSGIESEPLCALHDVALGQPLYRDYTAPPHLLRVYMPLFYWTPGLVARALHADRTDLLWIGRGTVYLAWLGIGVVVWVLARQARCSRQLSALAAALWLSGQVAPEWAVSYRPDLPALFFSLMALAVYQRGQQWPYRASAVALLVVAFFYKQSMVAAAAAIFLEEGLRGRPGRMICWGGVGVVTIGVLILLCEKLTGGTFLINVLGPLQGLAAVERPVAILQAVVVAGLAVFAGAFMACVLPASPYCPRLLRSYFIIAGVWAIVSSLKYASYLNYYLEPFAAGCVLTAGLLQSQSSTVATSRAGWIRTTWLGLALATSVIAIHAAVVQWRAARVIQPRVPAEILMSLRALDGPALIEDPWLALCQTQTPFMIDVTQFGALQRRGKFDDADIVRRIEAGQFVAVLTHFPLDAPKAWRFPPRWVGPMQRHYALAQSYPGNTDTFSQYLYRPRSPASP